MPQRYGSWSTVASRFYRWQQAGVWQRVLITLQQQPDATGQLDWKQHYVDSTIIRAHQHAAGAKGGRQKQKQKKLENKNAPGYFSHAQRKILVRKPYPYWTIELKFQVHQFTDVIN